jgi:hypothetical protein
VFIVKPCVWKHVDASAVSAQEFIYKTLAEPAAYIQAKASHFSGCVVKAF